MTSDIGYGGSTVADVQKFIKKALITPYVDATASIC